MPTSTQGEEGARGGGGGGLEKKHIEGICIYIYMYMGCEGYENVINSANSNNALMANNNH